MIIAHRFAPPSMEGPADLCGPGCVWGVDGGAGASAIHPPHTLTMCSAACSEGAEGGWRRQGWRVRG